MKLDARGEKVGTEAARLFNVGYNCAESVLLAVAQELGLQTQAVPAAASGFGGGIARHQLLCGAVSGAVLAIGMKLGRKTPDQPRDPIYNCVDQFLADFATVYGSTNCRNLTGIDFADQAVNSAQRDRVHREVCSPMVARAAGVAFTLLAGAGKP